MAIAILTENILTLNQAAQQLPRPVHPSTVWRWALRGLRGVRLETAMYAGTRVTSAESVQRFFAALNNEAATVRQSAASSEVDRKLDEIGI